MKKKFKNEVFFDIENKKTILKLNGKTYTCKCDGYEIIDKEKGVLLCLAKAHNYHYDDIKKLIDNSKMVEHSKFNVGDLVFVQDREQTYSTYRAWFKEYKSELEKKYKYNELPKIQNQYKIVAKGKHEYENNMLYAIQDLDGNVYLINENGLKK